MPTRPARTVAALAATVLAAHLLGLQWLAPPASRPAVALAATAGPAPGGAFVRLVVEAPPAASIPAQPVATASPALSRPVATAAPSPRPDGPAPAEPAGDALAAPPEWALAAATAPVPSGPVPAAAPAATPEAARVPAPTTLRYEVTGQTRGFSFGGSARLDWRHDGRQYEARLELAGPLGRPRVQRSAGRITAAGLAPLRFSDSNRSEEAAHFDAAAGRISFSGNQPDAALAPGAQDRLSLLVQLGALLAGHPAAARPGHMLAVQVATVREAEVWQLEVLGPEELRLPGGHLTTLKLQRLPRREHDQKVELWLAPGLDLLPVRVRLSQPRGDWVEQQWSGTDRR